MERIKERLYEILNGLQHKRFESIKKICEQIAVQDDIFKVDLHNGNGDVVCDDYLVGTIGITIDDDGFLKSFVFDFQLFYIKDNLGNYYITEVELLEEVI